MRNDGGSDKSRSYEGNEKWPDSIRTLRVELRGFARCENMREVKVDYKCIQNVVGVY